VTTFIVDLHCDLSFISVI